MNCTIQQEFVLNVWLNLYDEGAYAMCHQCHDSIYTWCHFIFQLHIFQLHIFQLYVQYKSQCIQKKKIKSDNDIIIYCVTNSNIISNWTYSTAFLAVSVYWWNFPRRCSRSKSLSQCHNHINHLRHYFLFPSWIQGHPIHINHIIWTQLSINTIWFRRMDV